MPDSMNIERERRALELLEQALGWPAAERDRRLQLELADDPEMLAEVRELLKSAAGVDESMPTLMVIAPERDETPPPERLGAFKLGELLGSGGMGRVFRATRVEGGFEQVVAIKLMRRTRVPGLLAEQFARERQILARLQHRNIAQLFDGGVTGDGLSYFVMELVTGRTLTQYAEQQKLSLEDTLQLFLQICAAVQYAHAHLVVHADIKPSNIIVADDGSAKLLDFGVARALADVSGQGEAKPLGYTYDYASPARRAGEPPSTIDDVYSLGVLLDELLQRFAAAPADLKSIGARARAEDPGKRYASVDALRDDLQRWFNAVPVRAHGRDWRYVAGKFLARHRLAVSLSAASLVLLAGAAVALAFLYIAAERARVRAEERFTDVRELSHFVLFDVYDRLEAVPRALTVRRDLAEAGQRYLDRLARDPDAPMAVRLEVIEGLRRLAQVQATAGGASLAQVPQARANLDRAEALATTLPDTPADRRMRALILARIALARSKLATSNDLDLPASQAALNRAEDLLSGVLSETPDDLEALDLQLDVAIDRSNTLQWQGDYVAAMAVAQRALGSAYLRGKAADAQAAGLQRARLLDIYAESAYYAGNPPAAEKPYREQLALLQKLSKQAPRDVRISRRLQRAGWALGTTLLELNRPREAEPILADATAMAQKLVFLEPDDRDLARSESIAASAYAQALVALGRSSEALPVLERSTQSRRKLWDEKPDDWGAARDYAISLATLADARSDSGDARAACADYTSALQAFDRIRAAGRLAKLDEDYALRLIHERMAKYCR